MDFSNPLLGDWQGPFGGVPPFDKFRIEHFQPALEAAMADQLERVDAIANDPAGATFDNTFVPLEAANRRFMFDIETLIRF